MKKAIVILSVLLSTQAFAFPPNEEAEILKVANALRSLASAVQNLGIQMAKPGSGAHDTNRSLFHAATWQYREAVQECTFGLTYLGNVVPSVGVPPVLSTRQAYVDAAISQFASCELYIIAAQNAVAPLVSAFPGGSWGSVTSPTGAALASLMSFDDTLPYLDFEQQPFPAVVTPHGDYLWAINKLQRSARYLYFLPMQTALVTYQSAATLPQSATENLGNALKEWGLAVNLHMRVFGMDLNAIHPTDAAIIATDIAAGNDLRPPIFFRLQRAIELLDTKAGGNFPPHVSGRAHETGATGHLQILGARTAAFFRDAAAANAGSVPILDGWKFADTDFMDGWADFDDITAAYVALVHGFPGPPPVFCPPGSTCSGAPPECPSQQVLFESISASGQVSALCVEVP